MEDDESLLEGILDGKEKPADLSLALLQKITNRFSKERKNGQGGFGAVYKGVFRERIVAVKRIFVNLQKIDIDDKLYDREFNNLWKINHENVVRFLGFCSNTCKKSIEKDGSMILADVRERLFCFEYISGGSLDKHITDELRGLEWETRYKIIMGICKGICYLHEQKIIHMDLKPTNILLYDRILPKITDFGLSRSITNSHTMAHPIGTLGYIAPEYRENRETTPACDIYSFGAIIMELVTRAMEVTDKQNVLRRWRHRWNKPPTPIQYQQVTRCIEIAVSCREKNPKDRPSICDIINILSESENTDGHTRQISPSLDEDDMLGIKPLELRLPSELKNKISCSVELTNGTRNCIAFNIKLPSSQYSAQPVKGIVQPGAMYVVTITVQARDAEGHDHADNFIMQSMKAGEGLRYEDIIERMSHAEAGEVVDEVDLMVVYEHTKPQDNSKGREETNRRAEEAENRKIGDYASTKGKLGSSENAGATSMVAEMSLLNLTSMVTQETTELLDIHPMELRFSFEPNKLIACPLYLTNNRDHHVAFRLQPQRQRYYHEWLCGTVPPRSTYTLHVTMKERKKPPPLGKDEILTILSSAISDDRLDLISKGKCENAYYNFFIDVKAKGIDKVHELKLKAVCDPQGATTTEIIPMSEDSEIFSMDVHPTEPWIIISLTKAHFRIWNYETKSIVHKAMREKEGLGPCDFWTSKFIERKQWIVAGGRDGCLHVYNYGNTTMEKVTSLKTHSERITCLAIHPTKSYVLAASYDFEIEMWDWEKDPKSARTFKGHTGSVCQISFNPKDTNTFATVSEDRNIKIWNLNSTDPTITMKGHRSKVRCLDYFAHAGKQYLITGSDDKTAKIWDLQKMCCVRTLEGHTKRVSTVCSHAILPLLMTGSWDGTVRLWDSNSFRLKGIHNFGLKKVLALASIMDGTGRVLIGYNCGLAFLSLEDVASRSENTM